MVWPRIAGMLWRTGFDVNGGGQSDHPTAPPPLLKNAPTNDSAGQGFLAAATPKERHCGRTNSIPVRQAGSGKRGLPPFGRCGMSGSNVAVLVSIHSTSAKGATASDLAMA